MPIYACEFLGNMYDIGSKLGFLKADIDFAKILLIFNMY